MSLIQRYVTSTGGGSGVSFADAWSFSDAVSNYAPGMVINVREETYNLGATDLATSATDYGPIIWRGRNATDDGDGRPVLNFGSNNITISGENMKFMNFDVTSGNIDKTIDCQGDNCILYKCKIYNYKSVNDGNNNAAAVIDRSSLINCLFSNLSISSTAFCVKVTHSIIMGCKFITNSPICCSNSIGYGGSIITNSLFIGLGNSLIGIKFIGEDTTYDPNSISNNTIYNFINGIVFNQIPPITVSSPILVSNNLFHTCVTDNPSFEGGYGIYSEFQNVPELITTLHMINNAHYNCTNGLHNLGDNLDVRTIECSNDPFANISADDYSLNANPTGGGLLRGAAASPAYNWS